MVRARVAHVFVALKGAGVYRWAVSSLERRMDHGEGGGGVIEPRKSRNLRRRTHEAVVRAHRDGGALERLPPGRDLAGQAM